MNILLDIVMVVEMKMGIAGAALATVISQCVSAILVTWSLTRAYDAMKLKFRELRMDARVLKKELKILFLQVNTSSMHLGTQSAKS